MGNVETENLKTELDTLTQENAQLKEKLAMADAKVISGVTAIRSTLACIELLAIPMPGKFAKVNTQKLAELMPVLEQVAGDLPTRPRLILDLLTSCIIETESGDYVPELLRATGDERVIKLADRIDDLVRKIRCL